MSDIGAENLTVGDKAELEQVKAAVEQQLADNGAGYSDEERAQLEERLEEITDYIKTIENAETAPEAILALPDSVSEDDAETAAQINAAKDLYDGLTDAEKALVDDEATEKLNNLLEQLQESEKPDPEPTADKPTILSPTADKPTIRLPREPGT